MTQPAPIAAKRAGLEAKMPSTEPGLLSWFLLSERDKERRYERHFSFSLEFIV